MLFAAQGYDTVMFDIEPLQVQAALSITANEIRQLGANNLLRGQLTVDQQINCISTTSNLESLVKKSFYIQECIPEQLELKQSLYKKLDKILEPETIVASSTSTFLPSLFTEKLKHCHNVSSNVLIGNAPPLFFTFC